MTEGWNVPAWTALVAAGVVLVVVLLLVAVVVSTRRARVMQAAAWASLHQEIQELRSRLDAPEPLPSPDDREYVITRLGEPDPEPSPVVPGPLFADLVLREGLVQAVSLGAGVRRALSAESRHRIRFAMRREVKRARKQRRLDDRQARREWQARQRASAA